MLEKQWTGKGGDRAICDWFWDRRLKAKTPHDVPSVLAAPHCYCFHILRSSITFLACSVSETPPLAVLEVRPDTLTSACGIDDVITWWGEVM